MPTYEYACRDCDAHIEVFQRISDEPLSTCGNCGGVLRKVFHPAGILLKGSGFYKTDNRPKGSSDGSSSDSKDAGSKKEPSSKKEPTGSKESTSSGSGAGEKTA